MGKATKRAVYWTWSASSYRETGSMTLCTCSVSPDPTWRSCRRNDFELDIHYSVCCSIGSVKVEWMEWEVGWLSKLFGYCNCSSFINMWLTIFNFWCTYVLSYFWKRTSLHINTLGTHFCVKSFCFAFWSHQCPKDVVSSLTFVYRAIYRSMNGLLYFLGSGHMVWANIITVSSHRLCLAGLRGHVCPFLFFTYVFLKNYTLYLQIIGIVVFDDG